MFNPDDYEMVEERLKKWWNDNPDGVVDTELVVDKPDYCVFVAKIYRTHADLKPTATGWARTMYDTNRQTREFGMELAETSAIGRALANYIYSGKKRASREEMSKTGKNFEDRAKTIAKETVKVENVRDPWTIVETEAPMPVADAVALLSDGYVEEIPTCQRHKIPMVPREGAKNGKPWKHYKCLGVFPEGCEQIVWMEIDKSGRWVPQRPRMKQGTIV